MVTIHASLRRLKRHKRRKNTNKNNKNNGSPKKEGSLRKPKRSLKSHHETISNRHQKIALKKASSIKRAQATAPVNDAVDYGKFPSRSHDAVIRGRFQRVVGFLLTRTSHRGIEPRCDFLTVIPY
jgi:hypothetical protein